MAYTGELTEDLLALLTDEHARRMDIGLSTTPCDRPRAESAVRAVYRAAGLADPVSVIWMDSPLGGCLAAAFTDQETRHPRRFPLDQQFHKVERRLRHTLDPQLFDQLDAQLNRAEHPVREREHGLEERLWDELGERDEQLEHRLSGPTNQPDEPPIDQRRGLLGAFRRWGVYRPTAREQLLDQVIDWRERRLWSNLHGSLDRQLPYELSKHILWAHSPWRSLLWLDGMSLAALKLGLRIVEIPPSPLLDAFVSTYESVGWWWPQRGAVILTDRPTALHRDATGLHNDRGPALRYRDGWAVYALQGVPVPSDLVEHGWDVQHILSEPNLEIRRVAIDHYGPRFPEDAGFRLVDRQPDPGNPGQTLALYDVPRHVFNTRLRALACVDGTADRHGTRRGYLLTVPADTPPDAIAAAAWTYDSDPDLYRNLARRT